MNLYYYEHIRSEEYLHDYKIRQILREALDLHSVERAELVERLLSSSLLSPDQSIDVLWAHEAGARINAYDTQQIKTISAQKIFDKIVDPEKRKNNEN